MSSNIEMVCKNIIAEINFSPYALLINKDAYIYCPDVIPIPYLHCRVILPRTRIFPFTTIKRTIAS